MRSKTVRTSPSPANKPFLPQAHAIRNISDPNFAPTGWSPLNATFHIEDPSAGRVQYTPARRRVAILGTEYSWEQAPLDDPDTDVWTLNNHAPLNAAGEVRADRWFEIHPPRVRTEERWRAVAGLPRPVYLRDLDGVTMYGVRYPQEQVERFLFQRGWRRYFVDSFAFMVAMALMEGAEWIGLYGAHLLTGSARERTVEAACVSYWIGVAEGAGVTVQVPQVPWGLGWHPYLYGDEQERLAVACYTAALVTSERDQQMLARVAHGKYLTEVLGT